MGAVGAQLLCWELGAVPVGFLGDFGSSKGPMRVLPGMVSGRRWMGKPMRDSASDLCFLCHQTLLFSDILKPQPEPPCPESYPTDGVKR